MQSTALNIERLDMQKLLGAASGDAALLYLYLKSGNDPQSAARELQMSQSRLSCAGATLRQLGLWQEDKLRIVPGERLRKQHRHRGSHSVYHAARLSETPHPQRGKKRK